MRTRLAYGVGALVLITGALTGPTWSFAATLPAAATCAILMVFLIAGRPMRRWLPAGTITAGVISQLATLWIFYVLDSDSRMSVTVSLAVLFELAALIWLMILLVRHVSVPGIWFGCAFAIPAQMAVFFRGFQETSTAIGTVASLLIWSIGSIAAVLGGLYLRGMDSSRAQAIRNAQQAQRMDLARDLHDYVAHDISGIVVQAQAAQAVAEQNPGAVLDSLRRIEQAGQQALSTMDRTVRMLRDPNTPEPTLGIEELPTLVQRFDESGPVSATLSIQPGLSDRLPHEVSATLYRVAVEGLTNVRRHAPDSVTVTVEVRSGRHDRVHCGDSADGHGSADDTGEPDQFDDETGLGDVGLTVRNDCASDTAVRSSEAGQPGAATRSGGGLGLAGLTERVTALGGELTAGPRNGGWILCVRLPLHRTLSGTELRTTREDGT